MQVISHRGYWREASEKNTRQAFERSFSLGFGTETDVRDLAGKLVISHDPPKGDELTLDELLEMAASTRLTLAINVKADGLASAIHTAMKHRGYENWFTFDMSIPDTRAQLAAGNPTFVRMSEIEPTPPYLQSASGVWLDAFEVDEWRIEALEGLLAHDTRVCIVSPELHKRDPQIFWQSLKNSGLYRSDNVLLCTDVPEQAVEFFQEKP
jgi:glycerophosphoryl diester phosphodiesterase